MCVRGLGVQAFENNTITPFNTGIELANVTKLYYDSDVSVFLAAGSDQGLYLYNSTTQIWNLTPFSQPVKDIVKGSNNTIYFSSLDKIYGTTDFTNFNQLPDLVLPENYTFNTIAYSEPYIYAGVLPSSYENNLPVIHRLNKNTLTWEEYTTGFSENPGIPQCLTLQGESKFMGSCFGLWGNIPEGQWKELPERLTAGQITNVSYNELDNYIWLGGAWGEVKVASNINDVFISNSEGLSFSQINDFAFTPNGTFVVQYGGVFFQENIGDPWEKRMNGLSSNGYTSIAYNPNNGKTVLLGFDKIYVSSDLGIQWTTELTGNFDQVEYSSQQDKFFVSDLSNLLSSDGTVINFQSFAQNVFPLDFAIKDNPTNWKIGLASFDTFYEIDENSNAISLGLNGLPSGSFVEKVTHNSSSDKWEGTDEIEIVEFNPNTSEWEQKALLNNYISCITRGGPANNSSSLGENILMVGTLGGGLYASTSAVGINDDKKIIISEFKLEQNYPNPFNPSTVIRYQIPVNSDVTLKVYDLLGREVETLVNEFKPAGKYEVEFNANNLNSGIYFYNLEADNFRETKKMILLK
jgi:hypothetical protein